MEIKFVDNSPLAKGHPDLPVQFPIRNFTVIESIWGKFILCRNAQYHPEEMIKTGRTIVPGDLETIASIISILPENCVIIDAGANVGAYCVPMSISARKRKGTIYAFEVQKKLYQALCGTIVLNDFDNIEIYNVGLSDQNETIKIPKVNYSVQQDYGIVSLANQSGIQDHDFVDVVTVDSLGFERLDFFKIDVEGMEINILRGAEETVKKYRPYFWIEYYNSNTEQLRQWFRDLGNYSVYQITGADIFCVPNEKAAASNLQINCPLFTK